MMNEFVKACEYVWENVCVCVCVDAALFNFEPLSVRRFLFKDRAKPMMK